MYYVIHRADAKATNLCKFTAFLCRNFDEALRKCKNLDRFANEASSRFRTITWIQDWVPSEDEVWKYHAPRGYRVACADSMTVLDAFPPPKVVDVHPGI